MNPVPLTSPDGLLRAWMCGVCESVHCSIEIPWPASDEKREKQARHYRDRAERCCICMQCRSAPVLYAGYCSQCIDTIRWSHFARCWRWIGESMAERDQAAAGGEG